VPDRGGFFSADRYVMDASAVAGFILNSLALHFSELVPLISVLRGLRLNRPLFVAMMFPVGGTIGRARPQPFSLTGTAWWLSWRWPR